MRLYTSDSESFVQDVPREAVRLLSKRPAGTSTILYLTSDAGEGKTTVIDHLALHQAQDYMDGKTNWLLVPMRLGGRSFLTFEDVIVAELVNRFRFQFFYYDAFIELVRLGVLVPAFDGFEEVFVEGSPGEAVSSLGNFVRTLDSSGSVVMAVRKAHFEYHNFRDQARLLDATSDVDATFARISLERWDREHFLTYAFRRSLSEPKGSRVYERVSERLGPNHPLLTRAVLAKRLVDVAQEGEIDNLMGRLGTDVADYFFHFVNAIVEREVVEKWIDRSGTPHQSLLTVDEHHVLLMMISKEMWITSSDAIDGDYLNLVTELFAEEFGKPPQITRQIANRIGQHSLMATNRAQRTAFSFDHDDFKMFYWGEALARMLALEGAPAVRTYLDRRKLPDVSADAAVAAMKRKGTGTGLAALTSLMTFVRQGTSTSYMAENVGALAIRILDAIDGEGHCLEGVYFMADSLKGRRLANIKFRECTFAGSSLEGSEMDGVVFTACSFDQLGITEDAKATRVQFDNCEISCVISKEEYVHSPASIASALRQIGFQIDRNGQDEDAETLEVVEYDERTVVAERALRTFLRASAVNEATLHRRLGSRASLFFGEVLPLMIEHGILREVEFKGRGQSQRRFKLGVPMLRVGEHMADSNRSSLEEFLDGLAVEE